MAETAAAAVAAPVKKAAPKKKTGVKKAASHPTYAAMITQAVKQLNEKHGASRQAIVKYVVANYKVEEKAAVKHVRMGLQRMILSKALRNTKGTGASGKFKLAESAPAKAKKSVKKSPKKKTASKKPAVAKKPTPKKVKKAPAKPKSPVKAKSPKKTKKAKTPKKAAAKKVAKK